MDKQQQANQIQEPLAPVEQPAVVLTSEPPAQPETAAEPAPQPEQPTDQPVSPEQDFMNAYNALCAEKGYELAFEVKPLFDGKIYDLAKVSIIYSVAKMK